MGKQWKQWETLFWGLQTTADGNCSHEIKTLAPSKKNYDQSRQHIKKQRHYFANKSPSSQSYGFSSSQVWMWELDYKESWAPKNWWIWTVVLEKPLESPLDCKEIKPVHPKRNQWRSFLYGSVYSCHLFLSSASIRSIPFLSFIFLYFWPDAGKDWWQEEKGMTEDKMVGWHHWLNGQEFE